MDSKDEDYWASFGSSGLVARPFSDLGPVRYIRFSAFGADWILEVSNDIESVWMAERFAAAAQAMLAALAREELCLVQSQINVRIENRLQIQTPGAEPIESLPSNDGRRWVIRLVPIEGSNAVDPQETAIELLAMLMMIIREVSLLPEDDFSKAMDKALQRGLGHKLSPARPYDELAVMFAPELEAQIDGAEYDTPWARSGG